MPEQTILIIEDDKEIRDGLRILLSGEGYSLLEAENGPQGLRLFSEALETIDLVILDIMMPGMNGLQVCEELRKRSSVPILFLTAKAQESDKLMGLTIGGDDYLVKPFSYAELVARTKALLRRYYVYRGKDASESFEAGWIRWAPIRIAKDHNEVWLRDKEVDLTELEYQILLLMMKHPGRIYSAQNIYELVWNETYYYTANATVMVHIRKLRLKLEKDPSNPKIIKTVWGKGYRFEQEASDGTDT